MIPGVGIDVLVRLADKLSGPLKDAEGTVAKASERMQKRLQLSMKLAGGGAAAGAVAFGAQRLVTGFTDSIRAVERAKGELATLGVQDLDAVVQRGQQMQTQLAGVTADAFVRAAYDIKSGISSLSDQGVADMTASAMVVAKATKGQAEQMTSLFATSYGIFKKHMGDLTDAEFGEQFGAALSASVQQFKTDGAAMQQAIESAGAGAVNLGMDMTEQLTLLGMMQQQMQAGEAGTALRAFATNAAKAHEAFAKMKVSTDRPVRVRVLDEKGQLRAMPDILSDLKARYGETLDAFEAAEIAKAFGTEEAMKMINALYGQEAAVRANADALESAAEQGAAYTEQMARAADSNWDATMVVLAQKMDVLRMKIGDRLLPVVKKLVPVFDAVIAKAFDWIDANPELVTGIGAVVAGIGAVAAVASPLLLGLGTMIATWSTVSFMATRFGVSLLGLINPISLVRGAFALLRGALLFSGVGLIAIGLGAAAAAIYRNWDRVKEVFAGLGPAFDGVVSMARAAFSGNWEGVWTGARAAVDGFASWWDGLDFAGKGWIDSAIASVGGFVSSLAETMSSLAPAFDGVVSAARAAFSGDWEGVWAGARSAVDGFANWWGGLDFAGKGAIEAVLSAMSSFADGVSASFSPAVQSLQDAWAQVGPIFSNLGEAFSSLIGAFSGGEGDPAVKLGALAQGLGKLAGLGIQALATGIEAIARGVETVTGVIAGALAGDVNRVMTELREFFDWLASGIAVPDWVQNFSFASMFDGLSVGGIVDALKTAFSFSWSDILPDWDWGAIIPEMPDWKFSLWGKDDQIEDPKTLLAAAEAATDLEARFPALSAAANDTLSAVQAAIAQITGLVQGVDLTAEGARIASSVAAGIRSQIGAVSAAAQAMGAAIRSALPGNANVNVALSGGAAPVQARASGGWYKPGWLLTGEQGPELRYATEGGFIAHNRALRGMMDMATRAREAVNGIGFDGMSQAPVPALASVASAAGPTMQRGPVTISPTYNMPMSFDGRVDIEQVRATVQQELLAAQEMMQADQRRVMYD